MSRNHPKRFVSRSTLGVAASTFLVLLAPACSKNQNDDEAAVAESRETLSSVQLPSEAPKLSEATERWTGDFDGMVERRVIRALVTYNKTFYFLDGEEQRGLACEALALFEEAVNRELGTGHPRVEVLIVPVSRHRLVPALVEGWGDIAAAGLSVTEERLELVDFSNPVFKGVSEVVVTGRGTSPIRVLEDLSGKEIVVRASSSYHESLRLLNAILARRSIAPMKLTLAEEVLEDEDLLEMVNAHLYPRVVVDSYKAEFWGQVFDEINVHSDIAVATSVEIAWAFRKGSPKLRDVVNRFVKEDKIGALIGDNSLKQYLRNTKWAERALSDSEIEKLRSAVDSFRKYGAIFDFDWLMLAALGYQVSRLDQSLRSPSGAIGIMQLVPSIAEDEHVNIQNIEVLENNIHAGVKYLRFICDRYFAGEGIDRLNKTYFAFASYKADPERIAGFRKTAEEMGLDPNVWFNNVEIAAAKETGREIVQYVSNIAKYYAAYRRGFTER